MEKIYNDVASVDLVEGTVVNFDELYNLVDSLTISSIVGNKNAKEAVHTNKPNNISTISINSLFNKGYNMP